MMYMRHPYLQKIKATYKGFSFTTFFFEFFVPIFRGDFYNAILLFFGGMIVNTFLNFFFNSDVIMAIGMLIWKLVIGFYYNEMHYRRLVDLGYEPLKIE